MPPKGGPPKRSKVTKGRSTQEGLDVDTSGIAVDSHQDQELDASEVVSPSGQELLVPGQPQSVTPLAKPQVALAAGQPKEVAKGSGAVVPLGQPLVGAMQNSVKATAAFAQSANGAAELLGQMAVKGASAVQKGAVDAVQMAGALVLGVEGKRVEEALDDMHKRFVQAIYDCETDNVAQLLQEGANPNVIAFEPKGHTALMIAAEKNLTAVIKMLLEQRAEIDAVNHAGETALFRAIEASQPEAARELIEAGSNLTLQTRAEAKSLVHRAAFYNNAETVNDLIAANAPFDIPDKNKRTPLHTAVQYGHVETLQRLLEARANVEARDVDGKGALLFGVECGQAEALRCLLQNGGTTADADIPWPSIIQRSDEVPAVLLRATLKEPEDVVRVRKWIRKAFLGEAPRTLFGKGPKAKDLGLEKAEDQGPKRPRELLLPQSEADLSWTAKLKQKKPGAATLAYLEMHEPCATRIIRALAETPNMDLMREKAAIAIVGHAWLEMQPWYVLEIAWSIAVLVCMVGISVDLNSRTVGRPGYILVISMQVLKRVVEEIAQLLHRGHEMRSYAMGTFLYMASVGSWVDWITSALHTSVIVVAAHYKGSPVERGFLGAAGAMTWLQVMYSLRGVRRVGLGMLPIIWAMRDTLSFVLVMAFCFGSISHAYYLTGAQVGSDSLYQSALRMYRLGFLGDFDLDDLEDIDTVYVSQDANSTQDEEWVPQSPDATPIQPLVHGIFYITSALMTITMMNILIAILSHNYDVHKDNANVIFLRERANMVTSMRCSPFRRLITCILGPGLRFLATYLHKTDGEATEEGVWRYKYYSTRLFRRVLPLGIQRTSYAKWQEGMYLWVSTRADVTAGPDASDEVRALKATVQSQASHVNDRLDKLQGLVEQIQASLAK